MFPIFEKLDEKITQYLTNGKITQEKFLALKSLLHSAESIISFGEHAKNSQRTILRTLTKRIAYELLKK